MKVKFGLNLKYDGTMIVEFLQKIRTAIRDANTQTESERISSLINFSVKNDLKEGFKIREHRQDVKSIALDRLEWIEARIEKERKEQRLEMLQKLSNFVSEFNRQIDVEISQLSGELGVGGGSRIREINEARIKAEKKMQAG